jgi:hypothetical protein
MTYSENVFFCSRDAPTVSAMVEAETHRYHMPQVHSRKKKWEKKTEGSFDKNFY